MILCRMPNLHIICVSMKLAILGPMMDRSGLASIHLVKYSIAMIINLWLPKEGGTNYHRRSKPHYAKGHID